MKKLNLKNLKLNDNDLLQREQLKTIFGGSGGQGGDPCKDECQSNSDCRDPNHPDCTTFHKQISCPSSPDVNNCI